MDSPVVPVKTALGHEELRQRRHAVGQRHRTVLFLVDGRRPLGEVLALANQAGAQTSHFEELVNLGLIELPVVPVADDPVPSVRDAIETPVVASVALDAPAAPAPDADADAGPGVAAAPWPADMLEPVAKPAHARSRASHAPRQDEVADAATLAEIGDLLIDTLRLDAPLFGARMLIRVRNARSTRELIDLVWEIEGHLSHVRRTRSELQSLQRARDLLGLGNTLVADDSRLELEVS